MSEYLFLSRWERIKVRVRSIRAQPGDHVPLDSQPAKRATKRSLLDGLPIIGSLAKQEFVAAVDAVEGNRAAGRQESKIHTEA